MKHTPGPWYYESDGEGRPNQRPDQYVVGPDGLDRIATCHWNSGDAPANARIIAAAPDGLELARAFKSYLEDDSRSERRRQACLAACNDFLKKATGQ